MAKKMLDVIRVGFFDKTGDDRSPEDFCLPACMTSLTQFLGANDPIITTYGHGRSYTKRTAYDDYLTATGMAFGLLWSDDMCMSIMDLTQVGDHDETIRRAFRWAGYSVEIIDRSGTSRRAIWNRIVRSIDAGMPVLAFGVIGPPECSLIAGYDDVGEALIGWSHFQDDEPVDIEPNGMFRKADWYDDLWKIVVPGKRTAQKRSAEEIARHGAAIMEKKRIGDYLAGFAAYDAWIDMVLGLGSVNEDALKARHELHHGLVGNHAEARCYGGGFLREHGYPEAGTCFAEIHDLCWKVWGVLDKTGWQGLREAEKREEIAVLLREIRALDEKALASLKAATA